MSNSSGSYLFFFLCLLHTLNVHSAQISFSPRPCAVAYTPNSVLIDPPPPGYLRYAGDRSRYSTCGGVCWFQGNRYVFAVNMQSSSVEIYAFIEDPCSLTPVCHYSNSDGIDLLRPESLSLSKNEKYLVIPNMRSGKVNIYEVDPEFYFKPVPIASIQDNHVHGARFSPDCNYLAYTTIGNDAKICIHQIVTNSEGPLSFLLSQTFKNPFEPLRPKSIEFSHDSRFAIIAYSSQVGSQPGNSKAIIASYKFDVIEGKIDSNPISVVEDLISAETVSFSTNSSNFSVVDQITDRITIHEFDIETGQIGKQYVALENPDAQLNFPHGISFSENGKYAAVSNYGEDKVNIYSIETTEK